MTPVIRSFRQEDVGSLAELERATFSVPWSEKAFAELLERPYCLYLVAEENGVVVGCAGLVMLGDEGDIDKVMVAKEYRGQGIGRQLVKSLLQEGEKRGIRAFTLEVRKSNEAAIALYRKLGFESEGIRPHFYEKPVEDAVIMWRRPN